jgi:hypothetical protein
VDPNPVHPIVDVWQTTVVGDTLMPNGHRYAIEQDKGGWPSYTRQQGDSVLIWSPYGEWLYFDFSRAPGDTVVTNRGVPGDTLLVVTVSRDTLFYFGARRCVWYFFMDIPHAIDDERGYRVVDSIGVVDIDLGFGGPYHFQGARVNGVVYGILTGVEVREGVVPDNYALSQNYPNPFNPSTTIGYALPRRSKVTLAIFNTLGQLVATLINREIEAGHHEVQFDAPGLASGVYFYRLQAGGYTQTRKLLLVR